MSRTRRAVPYKHYWGGTKKEAKEYWEEAKKSINKYPWNKTWIHYCERAYLLHGTDAKNYCYPTHEWFNRVNRIGRRIARDQLRPHIVLGDNFDFDDSHYHARYKGVWWDIY